MKRIRVLCVDDDLSICQSIERILTEEAYEVQSVLTGLQAGRLVREQEIDIVLLDMLLTDVDGLDLAKQLAGQYPAVPIILISGYGSIEKAVSAIKAGIYDFIEKPFSRDRIVVMVEKAAQWRQNQQELLFYRREAEEQNRMIGQSAALEQVRTLIAKIAPTSSPVLIHGESGTGKELVARAVHRQSHRRQKRLEKINCPAIPETLMESELFGHVKGAFTGASRNHTGRIQQADDSTLFLDEIGDLSLPAQAKLLRFLESGEIQRIGDNEVGQVDVRIIAATNMNLSAGIERERLRADLYYRLAVFTIHVPPLRERREDIPLLLDFFMQRLSRERGYTLPQLSMSALTVLQEYAWPGNVRQLRHFVERLVVLNGKASIDARDIQPMLDLSVASIDAGDDTNLAQAKHAFERRHILQVIDQAQGNMTRAARLLGLNRSNFYRKLHQLGLSPHTSASE